MGGCDRAGEARPQWVVHLSSDAPIPTLGDRVMIDVLDEQGNRCADCRRTFEVVETTPLPLSFGVAGIDGEAPLLRIRLYRSRNLDARGEPGDPTIDLLARLPAAREGVFEVDALLATQCFGQSADLATLSGCAPRNGMFEDAVVLAASGEALPLPNSFAGGDVPCKGSAPKGMVCIPGGVFLMGSFEHGSLGPDFDPVPEQLVRLSPYFIDVDEYTLDDLAAAGPGAPTPVPRSDTAPYCTYGVGMTGTYPVNCLRRAQAERLCELAGKRLPTEAEWEFVAANRNLDTTLPWLDGDTSSEEVCQRAVVARGGLLVPGHSRECLLLDPETLEGTSDGSPGDITELGVRRLGGNVAEWVADDFALYTDPACWGDDYVVRDPAFCDHGGVEGAVRGASFSDSLYNVRVFSRRRVDVDTRSASVGFRCAKDAGAGP
jgi:formylglycine-generating enzyme